MEKTELNNPIIRQTILRSRIADGTALVATAIATEFGVSTDTIRRDLLALENDGTVQRVRGGAIPTAEPAKPFHTRLRFSEPIPDEIITAALPAIRDGMVILLDGGTTITQLAHCLPRLERSLIVTPSPSVASISLEKGIQTILIGGRLSANGGVAVGSDAEQAINDTASDICFMGACGLDGAFGLSSDDIDESSLKRCMRLSSHRLIVLATSEKLGRKARHRTLNCDEIDQIITNAGLSTTSEIVSSGVDVVNV